MKLFAIFLVIVQELAYQFVGFQLPVRKDLVGVVGIDDVELTVLSKDFQVGLNSRLELFCNILPELLVFLRGGFIFGSFFRVGIIVIILIVDLFLLGLQLLLVNLFLVLIVQRSRFGFAGAKLRLLLFDGSSFRHADF